MHSRSPQQQQLILYLLTLNCARLPQPPEQLSQALSPTLPATPPNLLVLSLQELAPIAESFLGGTHITPYIASITDAVHAATAAAYDIRYELLGFHNIGLTAVMVFVHPLSAEDVCGLQWAGVGLGVAAMGNKGAVAVRLRLAGIPITAVAAHLAPDEFRVERRDKDWEMLVRGLVFDDGTQIYPSTKQGHLFLFGDLNYRTADSRPEAGTVFPAPDAPMEAWRERLDGDQLQRRRQAGMTFHALDEAPITFPPTYKYRVDAENGFEVKRWPSWTDRVLFLPSPALKVERYDSIPSYRGSDHKPVFALFRIRCDGAEEDGGAVVRPSWEISEGWKARHDLARNGEFWLGATTMALKNSGWFPLVLVVVFVGYYAWWR
ncbi:Endonuclease/exonuclease/phosphatase [Sphaerosporella brunnea]|uniref:Endonuclease/exonuclease/phosphatase n=1 Tax=Sphaerosporella brunnea TaxID=1250544 RepID=A0A5J5EQX5_9PEZI|nr:Endonuclease/exonuclease/phosphatase [Sphaerosporella brunnea]